MDLTPTSERFVLHWGEMGARWGINRTVAQVHALLYLAERPLHAEEICDTLSVARSNVSISLKELQAWGVVRVAHVLGDRRDHFECVQDVWEMFRAVLDARMKREVEPTLETLRECAKDAEGGRGNRHEAQRLQEMLEFFEALSEWHANIRNLPTPALKRFARLGGRIGDWLRPGGRTTMTESQESSQSAVDAQRDEADT